MLTPAQTMAAQAETAAYKASGTRRPARYLVSAMLAGSYIGVAVVLMVSAAGPLAAADSPWTKLVQGLVFGVALTLVVFAGGELATSNMMTLTQGALRGSVSWPTAAGTLLFSFVGNLAGALAFAGLVHGSGVLRSNAPAGQMVADMLAAKAHETNTELFFRAVLCNFLVCLAIWSVARVSSEGAKLTLIFWCLLAFITSGFEHVIANMTTFGLGLLGDLTTWAEFGRNLLVVGAGNLVGGAVLVGVAYAVVGGPAPAAAPAGTAPAQAAADGEAGVTARPPHAPAEPAR